MTVMWSEWADTDEPGEFDFCSLCGKATTLLVIASWPGNLVSVCGRCLEELQRGFDEMLRRRMKRGTLRDGADCPVCFKRGGPHSATLHNQEGVF